MIAYSGRAPALVFGVILLAGCAAANPGPVPVSAGAPAVAGLSPLGSSGAVVVANRHGDTVTSYGLRAKGNAVPIATIAGGSTGLNAPTFLALDRGGRLYVTNYHGDSLTVFAAGANGNVAPIQTIAGSHTGLRGPNGIALSGNSRIYVTDNASLEHSRVAIFSAGSNGNVAPIRTITGPNTGLNYAYGVVLDASGRIYVTNLGDSVTIFAPGAKGNDAPIRMISGSNTDLDLPTGIALDSAGRIYVVTAHHPKNPGRVLVFADNANGNVAPTQTIAGSKSGLDIPTGVAISGGKIYVTNRDNKITVYAAGANGDVPPLRTISGANTRLNTPLGIALR